MGNDAKTLRRRTDSFAGKIRRISDGFADDVTWDRTERLDNLLDRRSNNMIVERHDGGAVFVGVWLRDEYGIARLEIRREAGGRYAKGVGVVRVAGGGFRRVPISGALFGHLVDIVELSNPTRVDFEGWYQLIA